MVGLLQPTVERFRKLDDIAQKDFRDRLQAFVNLYAFLSQIIPYGDHSYERISAFGHALIPLVRADREEVADLGEEVEHEHYRLAKRSSGTPSISEDAPEYVSGPTEVGIANLEEERAPLSEIIETLNERFGTEFTEADRLFFDQIKESAIENDTIRQTALANTLDNVNLVIKPQIQHLMYERLSEHAQLVSRYPDDAEFQSMVYSGIARDIFEVAAKAAQETAELDIPVKVP